MKMTHRLSAIGRNLATSGIALAMLVGWAALAPRPAAADSPAPTTQQMTTATSASHETIAIAFQTNWQSVALECTSPSSPEGVG